MATAMTQPDLTLYYDGLCQLCSREVAFFRRRTKDDPTIHYVDIADPAFDAKGHGLDPVAIHRQMHVKVGDELRIGVPAFLAFWERVRGFGWLARIGRWPGVYQLLWVMYQGFARVRPLLPRRKSACASGACER